MDASVIQVGDWVRFQKDGGLAIGEVMYIHENDSRWPYERIVVTTIGSQNEGDILEARFDQRPLKREERT